MLQFQKMFAIYLFTHIQLLIILLYNLYTLYLCHFPYKFIFTSVLMPRRLLRSDFAPFTNNYVPNVTNNNGFEKQPLSESKSCLQYNGNPIIHNQVSGENDHFTATTSRHMGSCNDNTDIFSLYGQQQNPSVLHENESFRRQSISILNGDSSSKNHKLTAIADNVVDNPE